MYTKILQVRLGDQGTYCVWHTADTKLEAGSVRNLINDIFCDSVVDISSSSAATQLIKLCVGAFYDEIDILDADTVIKAAQADRHVLVYLDDNLLGRTDTCHCMRRTWSKVEIAVFVHWSNLKHSNIRRCL